MPDKVFYPVDKPGVIAVEFIALPTVRIEGDNIVKEGENALFNVVLNEPSQFDVLVDYQTIDGSAVQDHDYVFTAETVVIPAGELISPVTIQTVKKAVESPERSFKLYIENARVDGLAATLAITQNEAIATITKDEPVIVIPPPSEAYAYYNKWSAHPTAVAAATRSLRSQAELDLALTAKFRPSKYFTYDFENDPSPRKQDATRLYLAANQSKPPVGNRPTWYPGVRSGIITSIWDIFPDETWGNGMIVEGSDMTGHKSWRFYRYGGHSWWAHMFGYRPAYNGRVVLTDEFSVGNLPNGMTHKEGVAPCGEGTIFTQYPRSSTHYAMISNLWHRFVTEVRYLQPPEAFTSWNRTYNVTVQPNLKDTQGRWHMVSKWAIREGEGTPIRLLYQVPMSWSVPTDVLLPDNETTIGYTQLQFDTSQYAENCPERWCYHRGFITLKDYILPERPEDDTELFEAPVR